MNEKDNEKMVRISLHALDSVYKKIFFEQTIGYTSAVLMDEEKFAELKKKYESEKDDG